MRAVILVCVALALLVSVAQAKSSLERAAEAFNGLGNCPDNYHMCSDGIYCCPSGYKCGSGSGCPTGYCCVDDAISTGAIVGIVLGSIAFCCLCCGVIMWFQRRVAIQAAQAAATVLANQAGRGPAAYPIDQYPQAGPVPVVAVQHNGPPSYYPSGAPLPNQAQYAQGAPVALPPGHPQAAPACVPAPAYDASLAGGQGPSNAQAPSNVHAVPPGYSNAQAAAAPGTNNNYARFE